MIGAASQNIKLKYKTNKHKHLLLFCDYFNNKSFVLHLLGIYTRA